MEVIFESPWLLLTVAGVTLIAASVVRQVKTEWGYWPLLVPLIIAALAFGLDYIVKTDLEKVNSIISSAKNAAITGIMSDIMPFISPDYADRSYPSKEQLEVKLKKVFTNSGIKKIRTRSHVVDLKTDTANSQLHVVVHLDKNSRYAIAGSIVFVGLQFDYVKVGENWMVKRSDIISVNDNPWSGSWKQVP